MAAPTNVRVESNSLTTATLRWTASGNTLGVYRSTNGVSYSLVNAPLLAATDTSYIDTSVAVGTKYWYKVSDDAGATFSSVVTVVTQSCLPPAGSLDTFSLPRADEDSLLGDFNNLAERVENVLGGRVLAPDECIACVTDGAIVLNCAGHCREWLVIADADINSISIQYCDEGAGNIEFVIPANVTRRITGWPDGFGASGDEPSVVTGSEGRSMSVPSSPTGGRARPSSSRPGTSGGIGSGGGAGSGSCNCTAVNGALTIKACNANNSLDCTSTKQLQLIACGGRAPYSWSKTGSVTLLNTTGTTNTVKPPTNTGSAVAGDAYHRQCGQCIQCVGATCNNINTTTVTFGCADTATQACTTGTAACGGLSTTASDYSTPCCPDTPNPACAAAACPPGACPSSRTSVCDIRTAPMIAAGCAPCGLNQGATVSVTDAVGTVATIILRA